MKHFCIKLLPGDGIFALGALALTVCGALAFAGRKALAAEKINILALDQCMRQVNMQFMLDRDDFKKAQIALHREFVEKEN